MGIPLISPVLIDCAPVGAWTKLQANPLISLFPQWAFAETTVYDSETQKFWMVFLNHVNDIGLASSSDLLSWTIESLSLLPMEVLNTPGGAPHVLHHDGLWFLYYGKRLADSSVCIFYATSPAINGPYTSFASAALISPSVPWEGTETGEPFVFQDDDGTWKMLYNSLIRDSSGHASSEQVGLATASSPMGPFTKCAANPVLPLGAAGACDSAIIGDPAVIKVGGLYYVFYACGTTTSLPFKTALAVTTDLANPLAYVRQGLVLSPGLAGAWDSNGSFRSTVVRHGDVYYMTYTGHDGATYRVGAAVMPAKSVVIAKTSTP